MATRLRYIRVYYFPFFQNTLKGNAGIVAAVIAMLAICGSNVVTSGKPKMVRRATLDVSNRIIVWQKLKVASGHIDIRLFLLGIRMAFRVGSGLTNEQ